MLRSQKSAANSQVGKTSVVSSAPPLTSTKARDPPDGPNHEPTAMVSNTLPCSCGRLHCSTSLNIPCSVTTTGTNVQTVITGNPGKTTLSSFHSRLPPYLRRSVFCPSSSPHKSVTSRSENKSTDGSGTPPLRIPAAKVVIPGRHLRWSKPIPADVDESYSPLLIQSPRKCTHLNLSALVTRASRADRITTHINVVSPMSVQANTSHLAYTLS